MSQRTAARGRPGEHLVEELKWVHTMLRRDLSALEKVARQLAGEGSAQAARAAIGSLRTRSPLWQLRVNCLRYCQFVHAHHGAEDVALFPALRRADPALGPTVDKLQADHRAVSMLLDQVDALADLLGSEDTAENRQRLVAALDTLRRQLLAHLDFEEESISPTLSTWNRWPR